MYHIGHAVIVIAVMNTVILYPVLGLGEVMLCKTALCKLLVEKMGSHNT
jgi:hypothetical protein